MNDFDFDLQIDEGVDIPKREIQGRPRGSQYPFERMAVGQSFFLPVAGEEGATRKDKDGNVFELTVEEDLARKLRQKQSYFSQIGKSLGISIVTRTYPTGNASEYNERYDGMSGLGVWHNGPRTEKDGEEDVELEEEEA